MATTLAVDLAVSHSFCNYLQPLFCILGSMYKTGDMTLVHVSVLCACAAHLATCYSFAPFLLLVGSFECLFSYSKGLQKRLIMELSSALQPLGLLGWKTVYPLSYQEVHEKLMLIQAPNQEAEVTISILTLVHTYKLNSYLEVFISIAVGKPSQRLTISSIPYQM
ncbi:hypothetical protein D5086_028591 [Populus alba]|uniref:Uncharacterized protein n=1 Tax=Populus alba TaxID=43335 RepID=A0ACC4ARX8_POPAL